MYVAYNVHRLLIDAVSKHSSHDQGEEPAETASPSDANPPVHGARIVASIFGDSTLFNEWKQEMELMAGCTKNVRQRLLRPLAKS